MRCQVTVDTTADGKKTRISREGTLQITPTGATLSYAEENANVTLTLQNGVAQIVRQGDYTLCMRLEKGKTTNATLSLGGSVGEMQTATDRIAYAIVDGELSLHLKYTLLATGEPQKMQVKIHAKEV